MMVMHDAKQVLLCGTGAYRPQCREYATTNGDELALIRDGIDGERLVPFAPHYNHSYVYADGERQ